MKEITTENPEILKRRGGAKADAAQ